MTDFSALYEVAGAVLRAVDHSVLVYFLAYTGLRIGEAAALRVDNLDLLRREVRVVESVSIVNGRAHVGPTKTGANRVVTLPRLVVIELERHLAAYPPARGLVFGGPRGSYLNRHNFYNRVWVPARAGAGLPDPQPRVHNLRHTAVSLAIKTGAHAREIQARAGHSSKAITMNTYGHLFPGADLELADRLDQLASSWPEQSEQGKVVDLKGALSRTDSNSGAVAQLVEHLLCKQEVGGSSPLRSTEIRKAARQSAYFEQFP
jgi:integrase